MTGLLRTLYKKPENVPQEVMLFLRSAAETYPAKNIIKGQTLDEAHRYAGLSEALKEGYLYTQKETP